MSEAKKEEKRVVQAINPQRVALAESAKRHHVVTVEGTIKYPEDLLDPAYWSLIANRMTVGDTIEVRDDAMTYWAELLVLACEPTWAKTMLLREHKLGSTVTKQDQVKAGYEVEFKGPHLRYCVVRQSDKEIVHKQSQTREQAEDWLRDHLKAMKRAA